MPRKPSIPTYRLHKQSGQAIVTLRDALGRRKDVLLGVFGTPESRTEYARVIAEWEQSGHRLPTSSAEVFRATNLTINELILAYFQHAQTYYVKNGKPTSEVESIRQALRHLKRLYGHTSAKDFGPLGLKAVREEMVKQPILKRVHARDPETGDVVRDPKTGKPIWTEKVLRQGLARKNLNKQIGRVKRLFAWAVEEELVPVTVHQALMCVKGLRKGQAREKPRIKPVADEVVDATLPHLPEVVADMVRVQRLCGGRPQDVVELRAIDLDRTGPVWEYRPACYKTEHRNTDDAEERERIVFLGPRAQETLKKYLTLNVTDYLFSPKRSEEQRQVERRKERKTKLWPSHVRHQEQKRKASSQASPKDKYDVAAYRRAIRRACLKAGVPIWHPNQLRHARGTEIRKRYGLEASQAVLGHSELGVTQIYAEVDREAARRIMGEVG